MDTGLYSTVARLLGYCAYTIILCGKDMFKAHFIEYKWEWRSLSYSATKWEGVREEPSGVRMQVQCRSA